MLVCTHTIMKQTMFSNGINTQALRLQQFTRTISKFRKRAMAIRGRLNPTNVVSRMNVAILGVFLDPVYHAKFDRPRHLKPRVFARRDFYFRSARIVVVTHRSANQRVQAASPGLPDLLFWRQSSQIWLVLETIGAKKLFVFFSIFGFFCGQLAHAIRLVSSYFKYLAETCY